MTEIEITIRPHAHIVDMLCDPGDDAPDIWLGRELPATAVSRLERYQELGTARILEAIEDAAVVWSSEQVDASGGVQEVEMTPEDEAVRRRVEHILGQTLQEVCQWSPSEEGTA